jgi:hypothetical protein
MAILRLPLALSRSTINLAVGFALKAQWADNSWRGTGFGGSCLDGHSEPWAIGADILVFSGRPISRRPPHPTSSEKRPAHQVM